MNSHVHRLLTICCLTLVVCSRAAFGTSVVIRNYGGEIGIAVDSKRKNADTGDSFQACKVAEFDNGVFVAAARTSFATIPADQGFDAYADGVLAAKDLNDPDSMIDRFTTIITPKLNTFMRAAHIDTTGKYMHELTGEWPILEVAFIVTNGERVSFRARAFFGKSFPTQFGLANSEWPNTEYAVLGRREVEGYIAHHPEMFSKPALTFAEFFVRKAAAELPESVAEPITLVIVDRTGVKWKARDSCPAVNPPAHKKNGSVHKD